MRAGVRGMVSRAWGGLRYAARDLAVVWAWGAGVGWCVDGIHLHYCIVDVVLFYFVLFCVVLL